MKSRIEQDHEQHPDSPAAQRMRRYRDPEGKRVGETDIDALIRMKLCEMRRLSALRSTTQLSH
jgi:YD repeat-containing protein